MYEIFFLNFWVIILCPVFVHYNLKTQKPKKLKKTFSKNLVFFSPGIDELNFIHRMLYKDMH